MKKALITGATGQDGSYLSEMLLDKGYQVKGMARRTSTRTYERIEHLFDNENFSVVEGELSDSGSVYSIIQDYQPDEIYNTAAMSHVGTSFEQPDFTFQVNTIGLLNVLEGVRRFSPQSKVLHCSTSEMFGKNYDEQTDSFDGRTSIKYQDENTVFVPQSPYAVSKLAAHHLVRLYREAYGIFSCSSITFNHESPRRGENFVTRKITKWIGEFSYWKNNTVKWRDCSRRNVFEFDTDHIVYDYDGVHKIFPKLRLGNIDAFRDWSHAKDVVKAMHLMMQLDSADDFVLASEQTHSVRDFLKEAFSHIGIEDYMEYIVIDPKFFRPAEVDYLYGRAQKAKKVLGWVPENSFEELVHEMVDSDINATKEEKAANSAIW